MTKEKYIVKINSHGTVRWYDFDNPTRLHREDGPALEDSNGYKEWWLDGKLHREDGPAIEHANGDTYWYLDGKLHREDGPALEDFEGHKEWCLNGNLHREDGPAIEYADGDKAWYLNGNCLSEAKFNANMNPLSCEGKVVEIDGIKYKLTEV